MISLENKHQTRKKDTKKFEDDAVRLYANCEQFIYYSSTISSIYFIIHCHPAALSSIFSTLSEESLRIEYEKWKENHRCHIQNRKIFFLGCCSSLHSHHYRLVSPKNRPCHKNSNFLIYLFVYFLTSIFSYFISF